MTYLSTFQQVENWYNKTAPVVSHLHTKEDDIRPIGKRSCKHERVVKVSKNCYALLGGYLPDGVAYTEWIKTYHNDRHITVATPQELKRAAPIVWERRSNGRDYVTIHNSWHGQATGWYEFLRTYLPVGIDWPHSKDGRQWLAVRVVNGPSRFFVPLNRYVTPSHGVFVGPRDSAADTGLGSLPRFERKLTFKRLNTPYERWELVGEAYTAPTSTKYHIDKEAKRALKPHISEFKEWLSAVYPVLTDRTHAQAAAARKELCDYHTNWGRASFFGDWWRSSPEKVKDVLADPDSPGRVELAYALRNYQRDCDQDLPADERGDPSRFNTRFNNFINIACELRTQNKGEG